MNLRSTLFGLLCVLALAASAPVSAAPAANDYPTVDRVLYVQECMRQHPGPFYEMVNKCSCAFDALAGEVSYDDYVTMSTMANATSIGGERGGVIRDNEPAQAQIKRYKALQSKVLKGCFINPESK